jgi:hypothetical protein
MVTETAWLPGSLPTRPSCCPSFHRFRGRPEGNQAFAQLQQDTNVDHKVKVGHVDAHTGTVGRDEDPELPMWRQCSAVMD